MPKLTSLSGQVSDKENIAPNHRSSKSRATRRDKDDDEDERDDERSEPSGSKRVKTNAASTKVSKQSSKTTREYSVDDVNKREGSSSSDSAPLKRMRTSEEDNPRSDNEGKSKRERVLEEKLALITREKDQIQSQFDDLRELRYTDAEKLLSEWKGMADQRDRQAEACIAKLRSQLKSLEAKKEVMSSSSDGAFFGGNRNNHEEDLLSRERKLKEEVARLTQELSTSSMALKNKVGSGNMGHSDEKAVRRLYEDLTGLVVNKVELLQDKDKKHYRSYHAIFASSGYYNLEMKLEESESDMPSTSGGSRLRQDLIYIPALDSDRDAEVLTSGHLPSYLKESLRFERSTAVRFMNTLHKKLDRQTRRAN